VNEHDREHHWQRQSSLPSSLIPHLLSGLQQSGYSQTRPTLVPPTIHPRNGPHPVSPTLFDHHHQQFPPFNLILADTCPRCLDRGQPDVLSRLAKPFCCDFDPHLPPISPNIMGILCAVLSPKPLHARPRLLLGLKHTTAVTNCLPLTKVTMWRHFTGWVLTPTMY
jgi:hypothetical protein